MCLYNVDTVDSRWRWMQRLCEMFKPVQTSPVTESCGLSVSLSATNTLTDYLNL